LHILNRQPIRRQVVAATCLLLVPLTIAVLWSANRTRQERENELEEQAGSVAQTAATSLNQYLASLDSMASALVGHPAVVALSPESDRLFSEVMRGEPLLLNVLLTDARGLVKGSALPERLDRPTVNLPYVQQVVTRGQPVIGDLTTGQVTGKPTLVIAYPVRRDGAIVGVLGFGLDLMHLQMLFASVPLPEGSVVTLTDASSRVISRSHEAERYIGTAITRNPAKPKDVAAATMQVGLDGVPRFFGNAVVARGPWLMSVGIPTSVAVQRLTGLWRRSLTIIAVAIASALVLVLWLSNALSRDLGRLRSAAQRIAQGDLSPLRRMPVSNLEVAQLQDAFGTMASNLRDMRDALDRQVEEERKIREALQSLQRQVVRQERLTAVGLLVSGVAHELNNPLQAILGTAELLERDPALTATARDEIAFVKTQSGRAREIIRNLSRFSSQQSGPPALVDLRDVIAEAIQLRRRDLDVAAIALEVDAVSTRQVFANFTEVEQVLLNFVINAQQSIEAAGRGRGRILIRLYDAGKNVCVEVWDDGPGVTPNDEPKLFQPFFTTKPVGKGTGLGLSVSYGIIDAYGGSIGYRTNEWGGALFFFELPAADARQGAPRGADGSTQGSHDRSSLLPRSISPRV
jgi:C4-dicarboxylate-specific signal transduction histidine kinase